MKVGFSVHAQEVNLVRLIEGSKQYQVPLYQRTYSWRDKELSRLWDDLSALSDLANDSDKLHDHFMGSVVLAPSPRVVAGGIEQWLVIDGQQRLTTVSLLLAAIRERAKSMGDEVLCERVQDQFLSNRWAEGTFRYRILPTQADRPAYRRVMDGYIADLPSSNVSNAFRFFYSKLIGHDVDELRHLLSVVAGKLAFVSIATTKDDNAYRIFESLNNTGAKLTQGDLLRNHFFMLLPTRGEQVYQSIWLPMQERIGAESLEMLAYLDLVLRGRADVSRGNTYQEQATRLSSEVKTEEDVVLQLEALGRRSHYFSYLLDPTLVDDLRVRRALARVVEWGETAYPLLMLAFERADEGSATADDLVAAFRIVESFLVRRMLTGRTSAGLNRVFTSLPRDISQADNLPTKLRDLLASPRRRWATDDSLLASVSSLDFYSAGKQSQREFILRRFEENFNHKEHIDWRETKFSIEHVLPQTLSSEWIEMLRADLQPGESLTEVHDELLHNIGNVTLTAYNSELGNKSFLKKRERLAVSKLEMNVRIAAGVTWGRPEIRSRAGELAAAALRIWPGPAASLSEFYGK